MDHPYIHVSQLPGIKYLFSFFFPFHEAEKAFEAATKAMTEYQKARKNQSLIAALYHYHHAYETTNNRHNQYSAILINYATALNMQDQLFGVPRNLQEVVRLLEEAQKVVGNPPCRTDHYGLLLNNLGQAYLKQYRRSLNSGVLKSALDMFERARSQDVSSLGSSTYTDALIGSATALWTACELQPQADVDLAQLQSAIDYLEKAQAQNTQDTAIRAECYRNLAPVYDLRYERTKNPKDLELSIGYYNEASGLLHPTSPNHASTLFNLAKQQFKRHKLTKDPVDMKAAEHSRDAARELVDQVPEAEELNKQIKDLTKNMEFYAKWGQSDASSIWSERSDSSVSRRGTMLPISEEPESLMNEPLSAPSSKQPDRDAIRGTSEEKEPQSLNPVLASGWKSEVAGRGQSALARHQRSLAGTRSPK